MKRPPRRAGQLRETVVDIERLGFLGDGQATIDGRSVLVRGALPGERWRVRLPPGRGRQRHAEPVEALTRAHRQPPACRHFGSCGGCALQHLPPAIYDDLKRRRIADALRHRGVEFPDLEPTAKSPLGSRRRLRLAFDRGGALGLRRAGGKAVVAMRECVVADPSIVDALAPLGRIIRRLDAAGEVAVTVTRTGLDVALIGTVPADPATCEAIANETVKGSWARLSCRASIDDHPQIHWQISPPTIALAGTTVELPVSAFLQATAEGEAALQTFATASLAGAQDIADLFCGIGTIGLALVRADRRLAGFDSDRAAIAALRATERYAHLQARDLFADPLRGKELDRFEAVVIDPPRAGASAQCEAIAGSSLARVIYASCEPASFARDARMLADAGFRLRCLQPVDQFLFSAEIELIATFARD